jgi:hypothetical protein
MTTFIKEEDVIQVAKDLEMIITPKMVDDVLIMFDDEMSIEERPWQYVVQDLINEFKTELMLIQRN